MAFVMTVTLSSLAIQAIAAFHGAAVGGLRLDPLLVGRANVVYERGEKHPAAIL